VFKVIARASRAVGRVVRGDLTMLAIPVFLATMAIEARALHRGKHRLAAPGEPLEESNVERPLGYEPKDTAASVAMGLGMLIISTQVGRVLNPVDSKLFARRMARLGSRRFGFLGAVVVWDFFYYWSHRFGHERRILWAAHVNHHSSRRYNLSTALRQSWTNSISHWTHMPMFVLGFSPAQVARAGELNLLYQYWVHTEAIDRLPAPVERVLNTASHHRVHHGTNPQYLDRNYAGILIIWDRLFGTFEPEGERVVYGLTKDITSYNPLTIAFHEWRAMLGDVRRADSWSAKARQLVGPPV
jgi:sterol desaturase/sphingolipid hydroxylase (fatty acid hydroxylase superfamily)